MSVGELVALLSKRPQDLEVMVVADKERFAIVPARTVTLEGGGAGPFFIAINVERA